EEEARMMTYLEQLMGAIKFDKSLSMTEEQQEKFRFELPEMIFGTFCPGELLSGAPMPYASGACASTCPRPCCECWNTEAE
ncbi:MAG: hypothetical protein Q4D58_12315, partial [Synergistaceae bacterium]|nr:hypothetical protein [Synergistaceae bacterium]